MCHPHTKTHNMQGVRTNYTQVKFKPKITPVTSHSNSKTLMRNELDITAEKSLLTHSVDDSR